ncbi:hypothetical protein E5222_12915 [Alteraurantiacibacter aquimixticola]|uniref:Uncharacterized protein n=1 Tax=Alteraurantiacibacter aquimixticola TaxID=2489173 RepID=A0A4T3EYH0_9SPHN|nr:nucleotide synthetase [Alteraurantiacibacter aquimixticola]TIX49709.1 hypothetical protein E5222_12915 [Alteraurantiacibacter aquimixticola]
MNVTLCVADGRIALKLVPEPCRVEGQDYVAIEGNSAVVIKLIGEQVFFSKQYDAITMKGDFARYYGDLAYSELDEETGRYKCVTFRARFDKEGKTDSSHPFNINVDLYLPGSKPEWVPITIDPDIKNPPPWLGGGRG